MVNVLNFTTNTIRVLLYVIKLVINEKQSLLEVLKNVNNVLKDD